MKFTPGVNSQLCNEFRVGLYNALCGLQNIPAVVAVVFLFVEKRGQYLGDQLLLVRHGIGREAVTVSSLCSRRGTVEFGHIAIPP